MSTKKSVILTILSLFIIVLIMSSCSASKIMTESSTQDNAMDSVESPEMGFDYDEESGTDFNNSVEPKKVITSIYLSLETMEFDSTIKNLDNIINKNNGYIENSYVSNSSRTSNKVFKRAEYTIRIPRDNLEVFTSGVDSIGSVISKNTSREDITKQYYDTESRVDLLEAKEKRMIALLEKAQNMEDIIAIENQLSEIIHQKENLTRNILDMDDKISYSIVNINISEVEKLRTDITTETTFASKISNAFTDSLYMFKVGVQGFVVVFIYILPFALIAGLIGILVFKIKKIFTSKKK